MGILRRTSVFNIELDCFLSHLYVNLFHDCLIVVLSDPATNHLSYPRSEDAYAPRLPTQLFAAGVKLAAHTQPALRTGLVAPRLALAPGIPESNF